MAEKEEIQYSYALVKAEYYVSGLGSVGTHYPICWHSLPEQQATF